MSVQCSLFSVVSSSECFFVFCVFLVELWSVGFVLSQTSSGTLS